MGYVHMNSPHCPAISSIRQLESKSFGLNTGTLNFDKFWSKQARILQEKIAL